MSEREVEVLHALIARSEGSQVRLLFYPHDRWTAGDGRLLAMPTKRVRERSRRRDAVSQRGVHKATAALWHGDLGLTGPVPAGRRLPLTSLRLDSPTHGVPTTYRIAPLALTVGDGHEQVAARLGGQWLTTDQALARPNLSPTARAVLTPLAGLGSDGAALFGTAEETDDWTRQLAEARWDARHLGDLFDQMRPWLIERLWKDPNTHLLFREPDEVDDALNEGTVNALVGLSSFDPSRGTAASWTWMIVRNAAVGLLRQRQRHAGLRVGCEEALLGLADASEDPAQIAEETERETDLRRRLEEALQDESEGVRKAWRLRHEMDYTYAQAAKATGVPQGTLAARFHYIKKALLGE